MDERGAEVSEVRSLRKTKFDVVAVGLMLADGG